jgi:hypothetical protein
MFFGIYNLRCVIHSKQEGAILVTAKLASRTAGSRVGVRFLKLLNIVSFESSLLLLSTIFGLPPTHFTSKMASFCFLGSTPSSTGVCSEPLQSARAPSAVAVAEVVVLDNNMDDESALALTNCSALHCAQSSNVYLFIKHDATDASQHAILLFAVP